MWPGLVPARPWAAVLANWSAAACWFRVMAHPLFRRAIQGHWCLAEARRVDVAEHLADVARSFGDGGEAGRMYRQSFGRSRHLWWFRVENDVQDGRPGPGLRRALRGGCYEFVFDAATGRLRWDRRSVWCGY